MSARNHHKSTLSSEEAVRRNRCKHEVVKDLLGACKEEVGITLACRRAGLPVDRGKRLLDSLLNYGLLIEIPGKRRKYRITQRGYEWLGVYMKLEEILPLTEVD